MRINFSTGSQKPQGVVARVLTALAGGVVLIGVAMFSLVFLAVIAVAGLIFWVYFWWKTRAIRARIEEQLQAQRRAQAPYRDAGSQTAAPPDGDVIEGEAVRVVETGRMLDRTDGPQA